MGMDVFGNNPTSEVGSYFRNTSSAWSPLAQYVCEVAPEIASKCACWYSNDGYGLSEYDSRMLADILQNEIDSGRTEVYARRRQSELEAKPSEGSKVCNGTGTQKRSPDLATGGLSKNSMICGPCDAKGYCRPSAMEYVVCTRNVQHFANFLRTCGGFEIW